MAVQTSYSENLRPGLPGALVNMEHANLISRNVETVAGIPFGVAVARGSDDDGVIAVANGTTAILGITVRDRSVDPSFPNGFAQYDSARIATKGVIWVTASVAVNNGDPVYVTVATGAFVKSSGAGNVQIPNAVYDSSTSGAGLVKVRLA